MTTYNFKSSGKTQVQKKAEELTQTTQPIGIKTPLALSDKDGIFVMHYDFASQAEDNLKNLILTNWGERLGLYNFGANLRPLLADWTSQDDFDAQAIDRIGSAVQKWMPYVNLNEYVSNVEYRNGSINLIRIAITYNVPALNSLNKKLQISFNVM